MNTYIGIDNGVTGSICILDNEYTFIYKMPAKRELNYTKKKAYINRIDTKNLESVLNEHEGGASARCMVERPMINPMRFKASVSASRALEATLIVLENLGIGYEYIDSRKWQKQYLSSGLKGPELKKASLELGIRQIPDHADMLKQIGDADAYFIALYLKSIYQ